MAATKLIAMHQNKGRSVMQCLKDRTDYAKNGEKTEDGKYISSYKCQPDFVDWEFAQSKIDYLKKTWRQPKGDVIAYQIRQSFKPGEITPEEANEVGYETGMRFTKGKHAFIVATHVDRAHIHNHIIFNSTNLDCDRKFRDFWFSGIALQRLSDIICLEHEIYGEYTDRQEPYGIDECWLDVTDSAGIKGDGYKVAQEISSRIKSELGITVSIGVSFNKIFAKLGSDYKKPDAITTMNKDEYQTKAWPLPVSDLLYVGSATTKKLYSMGITTIGGLAQTDERILVGRFGKMGSILWSFANGYDESPVKIENTSAPVKSVGNSTTTPKDMETDEDVKIVLYILAESVAARLRENGFRCRTVEISLRDKDLYHFTKQVKLKNASNITKEIAEAGYRLYKESYRLPADEYEKQQLSPELFQKPLRSIGIRGTDLVTDYFWEQLDLFTDPGFREKQMKMDDAVDVIRRRFGFYSIQRGLMYRDRILSACDAKADHTVHPHGYFG